MKSLIDQISENYCNKTPCSKCRIIKMPVVLEWTFEGRPCCLDLMESENFKKYLAKHPRIARNLGVSEETIMELKNA